MKILSASQIRQWDQYTIEHAPITSIDLMERAAQKCAEWVEHNISSQKTVSVFCGPGNNGGDGLAIARILSKKGRAVDLFILKSDHYSPDFSTNLQRLESTLIKHFISTREDFPQLNAGNFIIDALYGAGLNRPLSGVAAELVQHLNHSQTIILSIDIASGLFADKSQNNNPAIRPTHTLSFQTFKLAFLLPENEPYTGIVHILDIGLHPAFQASAVMELVTAQKVQSLYTPRKQFSHKGTYGNLLLVAGSNGMMGAAVLAAKSCLRAGAGKLTCYIPKCGYQILQITVPEAMCITDKEDNYISDLSLSGKYDVIAAGPGIGQQIDKTLLEQLFTEKTPLVLDADALNLLAVNEHLLANLPANTILTPHPKEFERLFGKTRNHFDRLQLALNKAKELRIYIILKGKYSFIATPFGKGYFNPTGNSGMATGGTGDVLTGILLGLLGQYPLFEAVLLGVYLHGLAGDLAASNQSEEAMIAGDISNYLGAAFKQVAGKHD